jgi:hypothetical protein
VFIFGPNTAATKRKFEFWCPTVGKDQLICVPALKSFLTENNLKISGEMEDDTILDNHGLQNYFQGVLSS